VSARAAVPFPDSTWIQLGPLPDKLDSPLFALAVDPNNAAILLAGTQAGSIYRSADFGLTWKPVHRDLGRGVLTLAHNPYKRGVVMAGTRGGGAWKSADGGQTFTAVAGPPALSVRAFGFAKSLTAAATDRGVVIGGDTAPWAVVGLEKLRVSSLAVAAVNDPARIVAGADSTSGGEPLPIYNSLDGARTWSLVAGALGGSSMVTSLTAGPLGPKGDIRTLLMGTNSGLFTSIDNGASWLALPGAGALPVTDFTAAAFATTHNDRFYVASDGGGSERGGIWATADSGQHFTSLNSPLPAVTALAVSNEEQPMLYTATFRPADHAVMLWGFHDAGAPAQQPPTGVPPPAMAAAAGPAKVPAAASQHWLGVLLAGPEAPYLAIGAAAIAVLLLAGVAYVRRGRGF
jgi:hypothetical protein